MGRHRSSHLPHDRSSEHPQFRKDGRSRAVRNALAACIALTAVTGLGSLALPAPEAAAAAALSTAATTSTTTTTATTTAAASTAATAGSATLQGVIPVAAATPAAACTKFIATTGSDSASGSSSAPWRNVLQSLNKATPGAVLCVMPGTYTQEVVDSSVPDGTAAQGVTLRSYDSARPATLD